MAAIVHMLSATDCQRVICISWLISSFTYQIFSCTINIFFVTLARLSDQLLQFRVSSVNCLSTGKLTYWVIFISFVGYTNWHRSVVGWNVATVVWATYPHPTSLSIRVGHTLFAFHKHSLYFLTITYIVPFICYYILCYVMLYYIILYYISSPRGAALWPDSHAKWS